MSRLLQSFAIAIVVSYVAGCASSLIPVYNVEDQSVGRDLTREQVKQAITEGAKATGWMLREEGPGHLVGTYRIRAHTVLVDIEYTDKNYSINYKSSFEMKVYCNEQARQNSQMTITGRVPCPGNASPAYIHQNYRNWIMNLDTAIGQALSGV